VDADASTWDAWRGIEDTHWTVAVAFAAGGRQRQATWAFDPVLRTVEAGDDEARWLSADEPAAVGPLPTTTPRVSNVYDVEAEGGVAASTRRAAARAARDDEPLDLMTAMRQRTTVGRRSGRRRATTAQPAHRETAPALPLDGDTPAVADVADVADVMDAAAEAEALVERSVELELGERPTAAEAVAEPDDGERVEAVDDAETVDDEPVLEPPGAEVPPLDEDDDLDAEPEVADEEPAQTGEPVDSSDEDRQTAAPAARTASRRKQRPSVPSWDDIMFGAKRE
jgi:hypothetical protein